MNLGIVYYQLQLYPQAEDYLQTARDLFHQQGSGYWEAAAENELGLLYRDAGRWEQALASFEKLIAQRRAAGAADQVGVGLVNIGEIRLFQDHLEEARQAFEAGLKELSADTYRVDALIHLGLVYQVGGQYGPAQESFREALRITARIQRHEILPEANYRLGELLALLGEDEAALAYFQAAAAEVEAARSPLRDEELKIGLLGRWQQIYERLVLHCLHMDRAEEAFAWAERARARAFNELVLGAKGAEAVSGLKAGDVPSQELGRVLPAGSQALIYFTTGVLSRAGPMINALPPGGRLRQHLLVPARTVLFSITSQGLRAFDCGLDPNLLVQSSPRGYDPELALRPAILDRMGEKLFPHIGACPAGGRWYLAPHGPLHQVPFAAIRGGAPVSITYVASAGMLYRGLLAPFAGTAARSASGTALAVANPLPSGVNELIYAPREAEQVAALLGGRAWVDAGPKKEVLRQAAAEARWLHFACHGWFDYDKPLGSYLEIGRDERLTAGEIMFEWRIRAELVTLSACRSGSSRVLRGDEPFGLVRAFLAAGAGAVLVSQWAVDDFATFLLMGRLYRFFLENPGNRWSACLASAQHWLRQTPIEQVRREVGELPLPGWLAGLADGERPFQHPRYWAAFIVAGETG